MSTPSLRNALMLVSFSAGLPQLRKFDKQTSAEVSVAKQAALDAGRYNKMLLPKDVTKRLTAAVNNARAEHYRLTLPWTDEGWRALPVGAFIDYSNGMAEAERHFHKVAKDVIDDYEVTRHNDKARLGDLFNPMDYPPVEQFASRFRFDVVYRPVPDAADFRVDLSDSVVESIRQSISLQMQDAHKQAMDDCFQRAKEAVDPMAATLAKPMGNPFRDSLVGNIEELVELLPKLNYMQDPRIDLLVAEMRDKLTGNVQELREDPAVRLQKQQAAEKVASMLKGWV